MLSAVVSASAGGLRLPFPVLARTTGRGRMPLSAPQQRLMSPHVAFAASAGAAAARDDEPNSKPWLLVGLGNPGKIYQGTRHNVGFEMLDAIAEAEGISMSSIRFKALVGKGSIFNIPVMLAKPQTFMNASGGHGGHNGMRSVINHLKGSRDFPRLRIGIGRPAGKMDPASFVLRPFNKKEREELEFAFQKGIEAVRILLVHGLNKSATYVNSAQSQELLNS